MKKLLYLSTLALALAFTACNRTEPELKKAIGKLDPNATITIRPAKGVKQKAPGTAATGQIPGLTALEVVQQATALKYQSHYFDNRYHEELKDIGRGFREDMKDFETPALKMLGIDVITQSGEYYRDLTYAKNVFITDVNGDTLARIPDEVINAARPLIEAAYNDSNYTEVYRLFDEAFTFQPL